MSFFTDPSNTLGAKILEVFFIIMGLIVIYTGVRNLRDRSNPTRYGTCMFWSLLGVVIAFGRWIPATVDGALITLMAIPAILRRVGNGKSSVPGKRESSGNFARIGMRIFIPALSISVGAMIGALIPSIGALAGCCIGVMASAGILMALNHANTPRVFLDDSERLLSAMGPLSMLPMLLASLGAIFTQAGVGHVISKLAGGIIPKGNVTIGIVVLAVGGVVLVVITLLNVRERKYEIGVLTAIGITKAKVVAQFVIELLIVTMAGIAIGVAGGAAASVPVSNQLLAQQISSQESQASSQQAQFGRDADVPGAPGQGGGPNGSSGSSDGLDRQAQSDSQSGQPDQKPNGRSAQRGQRGLSKAVEYVSTVNATVNFKIIGELVLIGVALTLVSALVGVVAIVRYEPLQILADRS